MDEFTADAVLSHSLGLLGDVRLGAREWRQISLIPVMPSFSYRITF